MSLTEFNAEKVYRDWLAEGREEGFEQGRAEGHELGIAEGKDEKARDAAIGLYENGVSVEIIAKSLKLTEEKVREIIKQNITEKA